MSKPHGLAITLDNSGNLGLKVRTPNRVEDLVWQAVQEAQLAGMTVKQFRLEVAEAWEHERKEQLKDEMKELDR